MHSVIHDPQTDRATGVRVIDANTGEMVEYYSKLVFLAASCLGTTQIMLNSKDSRYPDGIANSSGTLGHYLGRSPHWELTHLESAEGFDDRFYNATRPNGIYIPRFRNLDARSMRSDYVRGFAYQGSSWRAGPQRGGFEAGIGEEL